MIQKKEIWKFSSVSGLTSFISLMLFLLIVSFQVLVAVFPDQSTPQKRGDSVATEMKYFDTETKSWKPFPSMARLVHATQCVCAEVVGNYLYVAVIEGDSRSHVMYRYHMVRNVWERLPHFHNNECFHVGCMSSVNEYIYVFSDTGLPQKSSLAQNDWQSGSQLPFLNKAEKLVLATAVSMGSKIYVLHGCYKENRQDPSYPALPKVIAKSAVVHVFDPLRNEWEQKASTKYPHFNSSLFVDQNNLYVAGGSVAICEMFLRLRVQPSGGDAPVEVYNGESNSWSVVQQNHIPSNKLGAVELLGGKVYFIINKFPIDSGIRIPPNEVYKMSLREWENSLEQISHTAVLCYLSVNKEMLSTVQAAARCPAVAWKSNLLSN